MLTRLMLGYLRQKPLAALQTLVLVALGSATLFLLAALTSQLSEHLHRQARGIDLVVGAKGSPLQIVLVGVYHVDVPTGNVPLTQIEALAAHPQVASVIPLSLGDSIRGARIVGTEESFIAHYGARFAAGRAFFSPMEAVLGAQAARDTGLKLGDTFIGAHGLGAEGAAHGEAPFTVVGVLEASHSVLDRLVLTSLESIWEMHDSHGHAPAQQPDQKQHQDHADHSHANEDARETTLALVRYKTPLAAATLPRQINQSAHLQAASPALESARLLTVFGWVVNILQGFAVAVLAVSLLGIFTALNQALRERRYDVAVMRAMGASPSFIARLLIAESVTLAFVGVLLGLLLAHGGLFLLAHELPPEVRINALRLTLSEVWVALGVLALAIVASALPLVRAYRRHAESVAQDLARA